MRGWAAVLFLPSLFAGCAGPNPPPFQFEAPAWLPGDAWSWRLGGDYDWEEKAYLQVIEAGPEPLVAWQGGCALALPSSSCPVDGLKPCPVAKRPEFARLDPHRMELVAVYADERITGIPSGPGCGIELASSFTSSSHRDAHAFLDFPLRPGKTWGGTTRDGDDGGEAFHAKVVGLVKAETDVGALDAVRVEYTIHSWGEETKTRGGSNGESPSTVVRRTDEEWVGALYYSPAAKTVVRHFRSYEYKLTTQVEGDPSQDDVSGFRKQDAWVLTGAVLGGALATDVTNALHAGSRPLRETTGTFLVPQRAPGWSIGPPGPDGTVRLPSDRPFPPGSTLSWRLLDSAYQVEQGGAVNETGLRLGPAPTPGPKFLRIEERGADGTLISMVETPLRLRYEAVIDVAWRLGQAGLDLRLPITHGSQAFHLVAVEELLTRDVEYRLEDERGDTVHRGETLDATFEPGPWALGRRGWDLELRRSQDFEATQRIHYWIEYQA